nr:EOG090X098F [Eulimnadia texana]
MAAHAGSSTTTGLQQQIKAAFGRWRKGQPPRHAPVSSDESQPLQLDSGRTQEGTFDVRSIQLTSNTKTFSHPHKSTVYPPYPSVPKAANPFSLVRGLKRRKTLEKNKDACVEESWKAISRSDQELHRLCVGPKSRSDNNLHRILREENTWTVFATLKGPPTKDDPDSKHSTAWTFGLFSESPPTERRSHNRSSHLLGKARNLLKRTSPGPSSQHAERALSSSATGRSGSEPDSCSVARFRSRTPTSDLPHRHLSEQQGHVWPERNQRRTRSLDRCTHVNLVEERESPASPVFQELFLQQPKVEAIRSVSSTKRSSITGSSCCSCGEVSATLSCSPKSSPRSSPIPETVIYGTREAPVLERHCVEGGEFIIAWLPDASRTSKPVPSTVSVPPSSSHTTAGEMHSLNSTSSSNSTASSRSFINKPARGWLHSDLLIGGEGISYVVRYIGCLEVNTSMKSLDFDTRSQIAKECINRVCEAAGLKTVDRKRKVDRRIQRILGDAPRMQHAGSDVTLTVTSSCLRLTTLEGNNVVACHDMPNISFASGGDADTLDFVAYVAKDSWHGRACFVLECGGGLAQDVITTVGQAFELRFKEYLKRTPRSGSAVPERVDIPPTRTDTSNAAASWNPDDPEYYNDLPGKVPPDVGPPPVPPLPNYQASSPSTPSTLSRNGSRVACLERPATRHGIAVDFSDNLIDLSSEISTPNVSGATASRYPDHEYVNGVMGNTTENKSLLNIKDPFDMRKETSAGAADPSTRITQGARFVRPGSAQAMVHGATSKPGASRAPGLSQEAQLAQEVWFHGPISRKDAENMLKHDGDFLVRESQGSPGQYVLTGMQSGHHKHLLLVDPEGVVRTKDRTFESVSHLINYHRNNALPIISAESVLLLKTPVPRVLHP